MSKFFIKSIMTTVRNLITHKSNNEAIAHLTIGLKNQYLHTSEEVIELLKDEDFLTICKEKLGLDVKSISLQSHQ